MQGKLPPERINAEVTKPRRGISIAAARLANGEFDTRVEVNATGEVQPLADSVNRMGEDLRRTIAERDALRQTLEQEIGKRKLIEQQLNRLKQASDLVVPQTTAVTSDPDLSHPKARILVVEDNPVNQYVVESYLECFGYHGSLAGNGLEAVAAVEAQRFDLILMDCRMPALNGYEATTRIRDLEKARNLDPVPIIAVTASAWATDREKCLAAGMNDYLAKPFDQAELQTMLTRWLPAAINHNRQPMDSETGTVNAREQPTSILDLAVVTDLRKLSEDALRKLNAVFRTNSAELIDKLHSALAQGDAETVCSSAHSLKSACGSVGAQRVQTLCNTLEIRARTGLLVDGEIQLERIDRECQRALVALNEAFGTLMLENRSRMELGGDAKILIAGDDPVAQLTTRLTLEQAGFRVRVADDGSTALTMFSEDPADLLIVDVELPGVDGFGVCAAVRQQRAGATVPVLMITGQDDLDSINRAYEAGATDFVSKPLNWTVLIQRLRYMLRASRLATAQQLARIGSWEWAPAAAFEPFECSDELYRLFGTEPGAFPVNLDTLAERTRPADRAVLRSTLLAPLKTGQPSRNTVHIETAEGIDLTLLVYAEAIPDKQGQPARLRGTFQDVTELKQAQEQIHQLAYYDSLTGLPNRPNFSEQVARELALARRHQHQFAVLFLDLDDFKRINDSLGHNTGDLLLKAVAERMRTSMRASDELARGSAMYDLPETHTLARIGGDEFTILLRQLRNSGDAAVVAERLLEALSQPVDLAGHSVIITSSIGIAVYPNDGDDIKALFQNADTAMYHAKHAGKAAYCFYDESMNAAAMERLTVEQELRRALEKGEFRLKYQPQLDLASNTVTGVESLLRWQNEHLGEIAPDDFIPLAEETGLIVPIGDWVLRTACKQTKAWQDEGLGALRVAVNLSARQFAQPRLTQRIAQILDDVGLEPRYLELELTESVLMENVEQAIEKMDALKAMGVHLAIDDFGTGYSSLSYLKRFPIDRLKIDRAFVHNVDQDADNAAITSAVVSMGHNLKLKVVAEGVETEDQRNFLQYHQCDEMQGYYLSRPLAPEQLVGLLRTHPTPSSSKIQLAITAERS